MGNGASVKDTTRKFNQSYMLAGELGHGAFSVVRLAVNKATGKNTAVKIISKKKLSPEDVDGLAMEIEILGTLQHPHIIKLYETFDEGEDIYIVTELVEGGELFDRIVAKSSYSEKEARDLIKVILQTLAYIHEQGIVHRDLKPENLLLCSERDDADIKIADFGFAKRVADLKPKETACGTPGYVAPEILRGKPYTTEVDIWSMGVICYVLLAGYPPFYDEDQKKLFKKIKAGRYHFHAEYWANTSTEAMDLIKCMLCVNQAQRWTAVQLLQHPWMLEGDEKLAQKSLTDSIINMRKFNARRRLRSAADAVIMANRLKGMGLGGGVLNARNPLKDADEMLQSLEETGEEIGEEEKALSAADADTTETGAAPQLWHPEEENADQQVVTLKFAPLRLRPDILIPVTPAVEDGAQTE